MDTMLTWDDAMKDVRVIDFRDPNNPIGRYCDDCDRYGLGDIVRTAIRGIEAIMQSETIYRRAGRASTLGFYDEGKRYERIAEQRNWLGLRRLETCLTLLDKAFKAKQVGEGKTLADVCRMEDLFRSSEKQKVLEIAFSQFTSQLLNMDNATGVEVREIVQEWKKIEKIVTKVGVYGLLQSLQQKVETLHKLRQRPDRGRKHASPLAWWKIVAIAILLGLAIAVVVSCFKKSKCEFILPASPAVVEAVKAIIALCP